jgi:hypothetical protein
MEITVALLSNSSVSIVYRINGPLVVKQTLFSRRSILAPSSRRLEVRAEPFCDVASPRKTLKRLLEPFAASGDDERIFWQGVIQHSLEDRC